MFQPWRTEDFVPDEKHSAPIHDDWEPASENRLNAIGALGPPTIIFDFWDTGSSKADLPAEVVGPPIDGDWADRIPLPLFEPRASESPFVLIIKSTPKERLAQRRARWLLSLLDLPSVSAHKAYLNEFEELFEHFEHQSIFRTLTQLALDDVSADEISTAFRLKIHWLECPILWSTHARGRRAPFIPADGEKMLGWTLAVRFAKLSMGRPAELIIDEDWYNEWLELPFADPTYWRFLDYVEARLEAFGSGALDLPRELRRIDEKTLRTNNLADLSIDGVGLGTSARAAQLVRLETDRWILHSQREDADQVLSAARI